MPQSRKDSSSQSSQSSQKGQKGQEGQEGQTGEEGEVGEEGEEGDGDAASAIDEKNALGGGEDRKSILGRERKSRYSRYSCCRGGGRRAEIVRELEETTHVHVHVHADGAPGGKRAEGQLSGGTGGERQRDEGGGKAGCRRDGERRAEECGTGGSEESTSPPPSPPASPSPPLLLASPPPVVASVDFASADFIASHDLPPSHPDLRYWTLPADRRLVLAWVVNATIFMAALYAARVHPPPGP